MLQALWRLREEITAGILNDGYCYKYDISLPLHDYYQVVEVMRQRLRQVTTRVVAYGHVGDGSCVVSFLLIETRKVTEMCLTPMAGKQAISISPFPGWTLKKMTESRKFWFSLLRLTVSSFRRDFYFATTAFK